MTVAMSARYCMKYVMTKLWFRFSGKSSSSTFTTALSRSRNCGILSRCWATRLIIFWTWCPIIFMQVLELPVNTCNKQTPPLMIFMQVLELHVNTCNKQTPPLMMFMQVLELPVNTCNKQTPPLMIFMQVLELPVNTCKQANTITTDLHADVGFTCEHL